MNRNHVLLALIAAVVIIFVSAMVIQPCAKWDFGFDLSSGKATGSWEPLPALYCLQASPQINEEDINIVKSIKKDLENIQELTELKTAEKNILTNKSQILESLSEQNPDLKPALVTTLKEVEKIQNELGELTIELSTIKVEYMNSLDGLNIIASSENDKETAFSKIELLTGPIIELDQKVYTWTDKVYITVIDPWSNKDPFETDTIGNKDDEIFIISESGHELRYFLYETGRDSSIFYGEIILTGFPDYDVNNDSSKQDATGSKNSMGPTRGLLPTNNTDTITVIYNYAPDEQVQTSALIRWNIGEITFLEPFYQLNDTATIRVIDPDLNTNPEASDFVLIKVKSDTSSDGIEVRLKETNESTGIFEGIIKFSTLKSGNNVLKTSFGDKITAIYLEKTLPEPYIIGDDLTIIDSSIIEKTLIPG